MIYQPTKDKKAKRLSLLFILTGIVLTALSSILPYRGIFQLIAVALVIIGVQLLVRYVLTDFLYRIEDREDGTSDFVVFKKQGKNDVKVCHVSLSNTLEVYRRTDKKPPCDTRFNYAQNLTDALTVLYHKDGEKRIEILIEPNEAFLNALMERVGNGEGTFSFLMN